MAVEADDPPSAESNGKNGVFGSMLIFSSNRAVPQNGTIFDLYWDGK
jgi:hypothetical protein